MRPAEAGDAIIVDEIRLRNAADDIEKAIKSMAKAIDDAEDTARPLTDTWQGLAKDAYQVRQAKWNQASEDLTTMLREVKRAVLDTADRFKQTEDNNVNQF